MRKPPKRFYMSVTWLLSILAHPLQQNILSAILMAAASLACVPAYAQDPLQPGEAVVTRFSGIKTQGGGAVIDADGVAVSVFGLNDTAQAITGSKWVNAPQRLAVTAREVGQVFGIAMDDAANIYLTASAAFGLHRTADNAGWLEGQWGEGGGPGTIWRLSAQSGYRPEIFATLSLNGRENSGPALGNIAYDRWNKQLYVSDLETGMIHRLSIADGSDLGHYDHGTQGRAAFVDAASGASRSLPAVAFDPATVAKISGCSGGDFAQTPDCWNIADFRRRVWGLGVRRDDASSEVRLYYALWASEGLGNADWAGAGEEQKNSIWSVRIGADGSFDTASVRREFYLPDFFAEGSGDQASSQAVADIAFPKLGEQSVMLIAERGGMRNLGLNAAAPFARPHESRVLRYEIGADGRWQESGRYDVGYYDRKNHGQPFIRSNAAGGVDFGFDFDESGALDSERPDEFVWMTGDSLCSPNGACFDQAAKRFSDISQVHGIQGTPGASINELAPEAALNPYPLSGYATPATVLDGSYIIDADGGTYTSRDDRTKIGDIEVFVPLPPTEVADGQEVIEEGITEETVTEPGSGEGVVEEEVTEEDVVVDGGGGPGGGADDDGRDDGGIPEGGDEGVAGWDFSIVKQGPDFCQPGIECTFTILITNNSAMDYEGPLLLDDELVSGGDRATFAGVEGAGWDCHGGDDSRVCRNDNIAIPAHGTTTFRVAFNVSEGESFMLENCAQFNWPLSPPEGSGMDDLAWRDLVVEQTLLAQGYMDVADGIDGTIDDATRDAIRAYQRDNGFAETGEIDMALLQNMFPGVTRRGDDNSGNDRGCSASAVIGDDVVHVGPDLSIEKDGPANCGEGAICRYTVTITNNGPGPFEGVLSLTDLPTGVDAADFENSFTMHAEINFLCEEAGDRVECRTSEPVTLEESESVSVQLNFSVPGSVPGDAIDNCCWLTDGEPTVEEGMDRNGVPTHDFAQRSGVQGDTVWRRSRLVRRVVFDPLDHRSAENRKAGKNAPKAGQGGIRLAQSLRAEPLKDRNMKNNRSCVRTPIVHRVRPLPRLFCEPGWTAYKRRADVPHGAQRRRLTRGKQFIWCAKRVEPLQCWSDKWQKVQPGFKRSGWTVRKRQRGVQVIWCARRVEPLQCWSKDWQKVQPGFKKQGWEVRKRQRGAEVVWCARHVEPCPKGIRCEGGSSRQGKCICDRPGRPRQVRIDQCTFACKPPVCPTARTLRSGTCCPPGKKANNSRTRCISDVDGGGGVVQCVGGRRVGGKCICPPNTDRTTPAPNVVACKPKPISCIGGKVSNGRCFCPRNMVAKRVSKNTYRCEKKAPVKVKKCPPGTIGVYPKCRKIVKPKKLIIKPCPKGTRRIGNKCVKIAPKAKKIAPKKTIKKLILKPCPKGTRRVGKRCVKIK